MLLNYITWNVKPELFSVGELTVRWYGFLWAVGIFLALIIVQKLYKHEKLPETWIDKQFLYVVIGTIVGARLGHCFFYEWHLLPQPVEFLGITFKYGNPYLTQPWKLLYIWQGGLASHGGAIGILIAMYLYHKNVTHRGFIWGLDRLVIGAAVTGLCIRLGNLMNSEIYGSATTLPWGFIFVRDGQTEPMHPTQIYEMLYCLATFLVCWWLYWKKEAYKRTGLIFGVFLLGIFGTRFLLEFIKLNQEAFEGGMILNMGQILSIPFIAWGVWLIYDSKNHIQPEEVKPPAANKPNRKK
ncbi:MAG TPA: prolipoprotein diacylglyceryl transferase [Paludibacteraceae bacterium]|nr:prolipoprotein diacylglyceryl transferase [Paludibacteraceae bacterium]HPT42413.1 prolipoprotein diacylglyceryl transferase [Paludibacteraceae bacterium]